MAEFCPSVDDHLRPAMDMFMNPSPSSGVVTLEPYVPEPKPQRISHKASMKRNIPKKFNDVTKNLNDEILPGVYENHSYDKYLTLEIPRDQVRDIFDVHRDIVKCCGRKPKIYPQGNGRLMIEAISPEESSKLLTISSLGGSPVKCTPNIGLNQSKGVIFAPQLIPYSEEKLERELLSQGVSQVRRIMRKVSGVLIPQPTLILTFKSRKLPEQIEAAWFKFKVREYIPRPRRCYHCQAFGHVVGSCRVKVQGLPPTCINCGKNAHGECNAPPSCFHCGGQHSCISRECEVFLFEKEVQATRVKERVTFQEAKSRTLSKFVRHGVSFASVINNRKRTRRNMTNHDLNKSMVTTQGVIPQSKEIKSSNPKRTRSRESLCEEPPMKSKHSEYVDDNSITPAMQTPVSAMKSQVIVADVHRSDSESLDSLPELVPNCVSTLGFWEATSAGGDASASLKMALDLAGASAPVGVVPVDAGVLTSLEVAPVEIGASASSEAALVETGALASSEAALVETGALASSEAALVETGASASLEVALVETGALASSEAALVETGTSTSLEAVLVETGASAPSEAVTVVTGASASLGAVPVVTGALPSSETAPEGTGACLDGDARKSSKGLPVIAGTNKSLQAPSVGAENSWKKVEKQGMQAKQINQSSRKIKLNTNKNKLQTEIKPEEKIERGTQPWKSKSSRGRNKK